jgi:hypothetical protein
MGVRQMEYNLRYKLGQVRNNLNKQQKEYLWAVTWGLPTKSIIYKIIGLKAEEEILINLIEKLGNRELRKTNEL